MMDENSKRELGEYLDDAIRKWRSRLANESNKKHSSFPAMESTDELIAICHIDALQSVRISIIGSTLSNDGD